MDYTNLIFSIAKTVGVSGQLLLAVCSHESNGFTMNYAAHDHGSPSFGICQLKENSARQLGFKGLAFELMDPKLNVYYSAKYLKYQQERYGDDWIAIVAAYNAGSYNPSRKIIGCPRNLKYLKKVQERLPEELQNRLDCGKMVEARN